MKRLITYIYVVCLSLMVWSQEQDNGRSFYIEAETAYSIGRLERVVELLDPNINSIKGTLKQSAYRLLALAKLGLDDNEAAERYVSLLLNENPYYSTIPEDPQRFIDMLEDLKRGMGGTITTASSQAESLAEVPVPTTLITEEMIRNSGARNLQEVLAAYVPGMNLIDCNDDINVAMRGIYSNTQEKILIMLNGHRLNSYTTNTAAPDFSLSLEKVKQIEVLRGPASSLYGGVALTAVVNIITWNGADIDGMKVKAGVGNHGQVRGDLVFGKRYFDLDLLVWGSVYASKGERRSVPDDRKDASVYVMPVDKISIGRIGGRPSYDFGIQLDWKGWQFLYDSHSSQVVAPYTLSTLAVSYDHDRYRTFNGIGPSFATTSNHADLSYSHQLGNLHLKYAVTYDKSDITRYQVINDEPMPELSKVLDVSDEVSTIFEKYGGTTRYVNGQDQDYGFQLKGDFAYGLGDNHKGTVNFGAEYNHFQLDDLRYQIGYDFVQTIPENTTLRDAGKGKENTANVYLQLKHQWKSLILNAGMRYDYKLRYNHSKANELSPRIALIWLRPKWNMKFSYSKSFVDAPYIYRKANVLSTLMSGGSEEEAQELLPERVHSLQLSFAGTNWAKGFNFEINGFYNNSTDLVMTHVTDYMNAGRNKTIGVEMMGNYKSPRFTADVNVTWMKTYKANLMGVENGIFTSNSMTDINANNNTPAIMSNAVLAWQASKRLKLHTHILFEGKQSSYNTDLVRLLQIMGCFDNADYFYEIGNIEEAEDWLDMAMSLFPELISKRDMSARAIVNAGAEYKLGKLTLGLNIHNLFGTRYNRSGMNTNLIIQQGRWFLFDVAYKF